jgi:hypothetical protein
MSFCWAKVGKAKLIANPIRATSKRIFIVSSRVVRRYDFRKKLLNGHSKEAILRGCYSNIP